MVTRKLQTEKRVYCPMHCHIGCFNQETINSEKCNKCIFKQKINEDNVECLYESGLFMHNMHVTEFSYRNATYQTKNIDDLSDEEYNKLTPEQKNGDVCNMCAFNCKLANDEEICLLRHSSDGDTLLCCYEGEYWVKVDEDQENDN